MQNWFRLSLISSGFIAVLVGYTSSVAIVFQAATAAGATTEQISSWMWALGLGMGATCIGLSLRYRAPILTAWSTPGAALLATSLPGLGIGQSIGVFLFCSLLITISGMTGAFQRIVQRVPHHIASAMLAGVLFRFGAELFIAMQNQWLMVGTMFIAFLLARRYLPRYTIPLALAAGIAAAAMLGQLRLERLEWELARPVLMMPEFSLSALLGVGLPLFIVTMTSQNVPGLAVLRANGYQTPASPLISWTGFTGVLLAPFGGYSYNLAAITAAICMSRDADPDPSRRYLAAVWAGIFYLVIGIFGATVAGLFEAFPPALVAAIAGLALLGTIGNSLATALSDEKGRDAALITFLATASGISFAGISSAFWGMLLGFALHLLTARRR
ncbi:benzoate/H(+) symporter BenE family transporter [Paracandidimonas soli]|uniref:Benzoate membrane transport protein n=1 Tax=Paracandidimonas soli TaxID=1917182 RepID=A0A4R3VDD8_9BURK|nr:benzoate/H(+) symporter BenE family transporter [Paracandidimonas soli]TCV01692.1 benzoate membrane transport protein [Paracandidimonas soli]